MSAGQQNLKPFSLSLSEDVISHLQVEALKAGVTPDTLASAVLTAHLKGSLSVEITQFPISEIAAGEVHVS
tara:strand:+ start:304 stop:516 length:213 start_codon:yes stop_codon:yes gene_type:complete